MLEWHPYTLSSGAHETDGEVHIKGLGDHTQQLIDRAQNKHRMWIRIDGPYGQLSLNYKRYPIVCLVGGGVGVRKIQKHWLFKF